jgi:hypothetical protein
MIRTPWNGLNSHSATQNNTDICVLKLSLPWLHELSQRATVQRDESKSSKPASVISAVVSFQTDTNEAFNVSLVLDSS